MHMQIPCRYPSKYLCILHVTLTLTGSIGHEVGVLTQNQLYMHIMVGVIEQNRRKLRKLSRQMSKSTRGSCCCHFLWPCGQGKKERNFRIVSQLYVSQIYPLVPGTARANGNEIGYPKQCEMSIVFWSRFWHVPNHCA